MDRKNSDNSGNSRDNDRPGSENLLSIIDLAVQTLKEKYNLTNDQIISRITGQKSDENELSIPVTIFNPVLSSLESICKYLKENLELKNSEIAKLIGRDNRTIWTTISKSKQKKPDKLIVEACPYNLPVKIFRDRKLSVLESIVSYLKEKKNLSFKEISVLLHRDQRNIWTLYQRSKKKRGIK